MNLIVSCLLAASLMGSVASMTPVEFEVPCERPDGIYAMSGVYYDGIVTDEDGHEWCFFEEGFPCDQEIPVQISFDGNGTPNLYDDSIVGVSCEQQEAVCGGELTTADTGETMYWFQATQSTNMWVLSSDELGFTPVTGDMIFICYCNDETQHHIAGAGFSHTVVL